MIHIVKGFSIINEADVDVFLEFPCFLYDPMNVGNLIPSSSAFSKPSMYIWKFLVHILLKPNFSLGKDFEHNLTCMLNEHNCLVAGTFFDTALLWDWYENWPPVLWPLLSFPNKVTCINILIIIIEYYSLLLEKSIKAYLDKNGRGRSLGVHTNESKPTHVTMQVPWVDQLKFEGSFWTIH